MEGRVCLFSGSRQFHRFSASLGGLEDSFHDALGEEADFGPGGIGSPLQDEVGKVFEEEGFLGAGIVGGVAGNPDLLSVEQGGVVADFVVGAQPGKGEGGVVAAEGLHEVIKGKESLRSGNPTRLFKGGVEGAVKRGGASAVEKKVAAHLDRDAVLFREEKAAHRTGQFPVEGTEGEAEAIPTEVAETAGGFEAGIEADVVLKILATEKGEAAFDATEFADGLDVLEDFEQLGEAAVVIEHDAVHELDLVVFAGFDHFDEVSEGGRAGLFAEHVFAGLGGADDPFLAQAGGEGNVDGIDFGVGEDGFVSFHGEWSFFKRHRSLAGIDEGLGPLGVAAADAFQDSVPGALHRGPIFFGNPGGTEEAPNEVVFHGASIPAGRGGCNRKSWASANFIGYSRLRALTTSRARAMEPSAV